MLHVVTGVGVHSFLKRAVFVPHSICSSTVKYSDAAITAYSCLIKAYGVFYAFVLFVHCILAIVVELLKECSKFSVYFIIKNKHFPPSPPPQPPHLLYIGAEIKNKTVKQK